LSIETEVRELRLKFPESSELLFRDLSLRVAVGEKVLLLGPSGCGKSTLLQVLTGIIPRSVEVPMRCEHLVSPSSWGYVFQDPDTQFCMPYVDEEMAFVLENLRVPREEMRGRMEALLKQVGLELPDLHIPINRLSQGMKQRLAIAGVLAMEPDTWLLDEPTALLDPEGTKQVWETVQQVGRSKTMIIVEHKIDIVIDFVDRIILFDDSGSIIADGPKDIVFNEKRELLREYGIWYPGVWEDMLRERQSRVQEDNSVHQPVAKSGLPLLKLEEFTGMRQPSFRVSIQEADVQQGEWIAIVGKNGAGKSSLLLALMKLIATSGSYQLRGKPVQSTGQLTEDLAYVFQNPEFQFVTNQVYDEVAYSLRLDHAPEAEVKSRVEELLQFFGLADYRGNHPYQLSMGQKRRLSVACAVVKEQKVLLLDEPTFGQDAKNTFAILEKLEQWRQGGTTIMMVTHDMNIVRDYATRVWEVDSGRVIDRQPDRRLPLIETAEEEVLSCT
jgi:energy-coupling factor transport system ATP-binding protein